MIYPGNLATCLNSLGAQPISELFRTLESSYTLTRIERIQIIDQAMITIEKMYCHLPLKLSRHPINPLRALRLLRMEVNERMRGEDHEQPGEMSFPTLDFHNSMVAIFNSLRDPHTSFIGPNYIAENMTFLPFLMESYFGEAGKGKKERYIVTRLLAGFEHDLFKEGVEIVEWNGMPVVDAVLQKTNDVNGGNHEARRALAQMSMTVRWLGSSTLSREKEVYISYRPQESDQGPDEQDIHRIILPWSFLKIDAAKIDFFDIRDFKIFDSINNNSIFQHLQRRFLFRSEGLNSHEPSDSLEGLEEIPVPVEAGLENIIEASIVQLKNSGESNKEYGYIRLRSFICDGQAFSQAFKKLLTDKMPTHGVVIDLRGNPGGIISNAECLLQFLTPQEIEPLKFCYLANEMTQELLEKDQKNYSLRYKWRTSIGNSLSTGAPFSDAYSITNVETANSLGQQYFGPVVIIVDAMTYSAAEMFTAGFADYSNGDIIFSDKTTGGGGASVMYQDDALEILDGHPDLDVLPDSCRIRFALMRCDRENYGKSIEEFGVSSKDATLKGRAHLYQATRSDLFKNNIDLKKKAFEILGKKEPHWLRPVVDRSGNLILDESGNIRIEKSAKIKYINLYLDDRPFWASNLLDNDGPVEVPTGQKPGWKQSKVEGLDGSARKLLASLRFKSNPS